MSTDDNDLTMMTGFVTPGRRLNKLDATVAPTANEDIDDGYEVMSIWVDTTADDAYICLDSTAAAAVWKKITP